MSTDPRDPANQRAAAINQAVSDAKGAAATAVAAAATNAAKNGFKSSEFWTVLGGIGLSTLAIALKTASIVPGPWQIPALIAAIGLSAGGYAFSRGKVKQGALDAASAMVTAGIPIALGAKPPASLDSPDDVITSPGKPQSLLGR